LERNEIAVITVREVGAAFAYVTRVDCSAGELTNRNMAECVKQTKWKREGPDSKYL
jgi:hypothetical protein